MPVKQIIFQIIGLFQLLLLVWVFMSWIPSLRATSVYRSLDNIFEKLLSPIRKVIPPIGGTFDISPIILMLILQWALIPILARIL